MLFAKGFVDWFKSKELADVLIHTTVASSKGKSKEKDKSSGEPTSADYNAHRIILSYHSHFFLDWFKKNLPPSSQSAAASAEPPGGESLTLSSSEDSGAKPDDPASPSSANSATKKKRKHKSNSRGEQPTMAYTIEIQFSNLRQFKFFPTILQYLYGQSFEINEENAFSTLSLANKFRIEALQTSAEAFINSLITRENALKVLKMSVDFADEEMIEIKQQCITSIARNMQACIDLGIKMDLKWLPVEDFCAIIHHKSLAASEELTVYRLIRSYLRGANAQANPSPELMKKLFSAVKIPYLKLSELEAVTKDKVIPDDLLTEGILFRLASFERPNREINVDTLPPWLQKRPVVGRLFDYQHDLDNRGVIYYLSTNYLKSEWKNASLTGSIKVTASSIEKGKVHNVVDHESVECWTKEIPSSWFAIDLRQGKLMPTCYTLRHGGATKMDALRNWVLQASHDGQDWVELSRHQNDQFLNGPFATHTWKIDHSKPNSYRHFRILQTGHNSGNNNFLALSSIELYGEYFANPKGPLLASAGAQPGLATSQTLLNPGAVASAGQTQPQSPTPN